MFANTSLALEKPMNDPSIQPKEAAPRGTRIAIFFIDTKIRNKSVVINP